MVDQIEALFPKLKGGVYRVTSGRTGDYNCVAWAAGDKGKWWWPDDPDDDAIFWPAGAAWEETPAAFVSAFAVLGYSPCADPAPETGFEKVAIYADGRGIPTHAARQLLDGRWSSKLGFLEDIEHDLQDLTGAEYGDVVQFLRRPVSPP